MQINFTEMAGLIALLPGALFALLAARRVQQGRGSRRTLWTLIAATHTLLAIEVVAGIRHRANRVVGEWLTAAQLYPERRPAQAALLLALILLAILAARSSARAAATWQQSVAAASTIALILLFLVEGVSLHAWDAVLYRPVGPVLTIAWLWLALGWTTAAAAAASASAKAGDASIGRRANRP